MSLFAEFPDNEAIALGHDHQAQAILNDPELCPHFSEHGRRDIAYALRVLAIMERVKPGVSPWDAVFMRIYELEGICRELLRALSDSDEEGLIEHSDTVMRARAIVGEGD